MIFSTLAAALAAGLGGCIGLWSPGTKAPYKIEQVKNTQNLAPFVVIGSGPAGYMAAVYAARLGRQTWVIEGGKPGGLLTETSTVENWPGEVAIQGPDIMRKLRAQAEASGARIIQDTVTKLSTSKWPYKIETENGLTINALSVLIATGATPRRKGVPGEDQYWGSGVSSCAVCDAAFYKGDDVVVIGGGDSAVEEATQLAPFARSVTVLVRKDRMRAAPSTQDHLKGYPNISIRHNADVQEVLGDGTTVTGVKLLDPRTGQSSELATSGVFLAIGHDPNTKWLKGAVKTDNDGYIAVYGRSQETSKAGIYAAGDVEDRVYRQASVAAGSGVRAALDANRFLTEVGLDKDALEKLEPSFFNGATRSVGTTAKADIKVVTSMAELEEVFKATEGLVIADFYADFCGPCKQLMPTFESFAGEMGGADVRFIKIDTQKASDVADRYTVQRIPLLMAFDGGKVVARYAPVTSDGKLISRSELVQFVQGLLNERAAAGDSNNK